MKRVIFPLVTFFAVTCFWQLATFWFHIEKWILPSPFEIAVSFYNSRAIILYHLVPTLIEAILGLFSAVIFGVAVSILMKYSQTFKRIIYPICILSQTIPFITLAPLLTIWFGFGLLPKIIVITLVCFFPITLNLFDGFNSSDQAKIKLLHSMGATKTQILKYVIWPGSLSHFFSGLKIAASYCILGAVVSEWVGADRGLGILLIRASKSYLTERVFATVIVITMLSICIVFIIELISKITIPWNFDNE